jgi:hypothetical protein
MFPCWTSPEFVILMSMQNSMWLQYSIMQFDFVSHKALASDDECSNDINSNGPLDYASKKFNSTCWSTRK